jgi:hypothetical protein
MKSIKLGRVLEVLGALLVASPGVMAGSHTWEIWEVFSNADRTVQFVELKEFNGDTAEFGLGGHLCVSQPSNTSSGMNNVTGNTAFTYYLLGTAAFAALPGAPVPDKIIPANFIKATDTHVDYSGTTLAFSVSWAAGTLPTNGISSLNKTAAHSAISTAPNSPTNYAGVVGSVDASGGPSLPGVPDGSTGSPLLVGKTTPDGSTLSISWDAATCTDGNDHQILYGQKSGFPALAGGTYTLQGGTCSIGSTSPYSWVGTPNAIDGNGLTWFLLVTKTAAGVEGPWGDYDTANNERNGATSSGVCSTTSKSLAGTCGH